MTKLGGGVERKKCFNVGSDPSAASAAFASFSHFLFTFKMPEQLWPAEAEKNLIKLTPTQQQADNVWVVGCTDHPQCGCQGASEQCFQNE